MFQNEKKEDDSMPQNQNVGENIKEQKRDNVVSAFENNEYGGLEDIFADVDKYKQEQSNLKMNQESAPQVVSSPVQDSIGDTDKKRIIMGSRNVKIIVISSAVIITLTTIYAIIILRPKTPTQPVIQGDDVVDIATTTEEVVEVVVEEVPAQEPASPVDTDGDGIIDDVEQLLRTSIDNIDTDSDGLSDYDEVYVYNTNPLNIDTDNDELSDYKEVITYHTDPLNSDTDGDGYFDGTEVQNEYNPLGAGKLQ